MNMNEKKKRLISQLEGNNRKKFIECLNTIKKSFPVNVERLTIQFNNRLECINFIKKFLIGLNCLDWEYKPIPKPIRAGLDNEIKYKETPEIDLSTLKINDTGEMILEVFMSMDDKEQKN